MSHTIVFYILRTNLNEATVAARRIENDDIPFYTRSPSAVVASVRKGSMMTVVDGFRILDERGQSVFDYLDMERFGGSSTSI